jgi:hypothetical protein
MSRYFSSSLPAGGRLVRVAFQEKERMNRQPLALRKLRQPVEHQRDLLGSLDRVGRVEPAVR